MQTYETIFITIPTLTDQEESDLVTGWAGLVTESGGALVANERMGRRRLAYPIRKFEDGVYTRFLYDSEAAVPQELERRFRLSDKVLRHLTVRLERDRAVASKEQAVRDAEARAAAEAARRREAEEAAARDESEAAPQAADETAKTAATAGGESADEPSTADAERPTTEETDAEVEKGDD